MMEVPEVLARRDSGIQLGRDNCLKIEDILKRSQNIVELVGCFCW